VQQVLLAPVPRYGRSRRFVVSLEVLPVALEEVVNEGFLSRYRALLDAEDSAFDELEHAYEDGDREHFLADLATWSTAIQRRWAFLARAGVPLDGQPGTSPSGNQGAENVDALA
jgi:hypothetical protein